MCYGPCVRCANTIGAGGIGAPIVVAWGASVSLSANRQCLPSMISQLWFADFFYHVRSAITIGAGGIGAPLVLAHYKEDDRVRCASPIYMLIAYYLGFTNRKRKYHEEKTTATLKNKQTSTAAVRRHLLTIVSLPDPPHFSLPTTFKLSKKCLGSRIEGSKRHRFPDSSVGDPDPHVFGPPGSGSIR
jgi:hypothetical protein